MSLLWEPKEERMKKLEKLKMLATTVDGLPRLLKGVGDEIGKQFHSSLNATQGYQEEQHKEVMESILAFEKNIHGAMLAAMERQKVELSEQIKNAQVQTIKSVGEMIERLGGKLGNIEEIGEETRGVGFGIAEIIQKTIGALSEGIASLGTVTPMGSALKQRRLDNEGTVGHEETVVSNEESLSEKQRSIADLTQYLSNRSVARG